MAAFFQVIIEFDQKLSVTISIVQQQTYLFLARPIYRPRSTNHLAISWFIDERVMFDVSLQGLEKEWTNLSSLVTHHTIMPELLPCTLKVPRTPRRNGSTASHSSTASSCASNRSSSSRNSDQTNQLTESQLRSTVSGLV